MPLTIIHATIVNRTSLSGAIDCSAAPPVRISAPAAWTAANLSFQVSSDGTTFEDLFDTTGKEVMVNVMPGTVVRLSAGFAVSPVSQVALGHARGAGAAVGRPDFQHCAGDTLKEANHADQARRSAAG